ncbi:30S ribosomal protein S6e [Candidatus Woesearchaeota archaeon]|nr:30S ribosomal protein S6e [Candidatus Woesearchaeota archaeon]
MQEFRTTISDPKTGKSYNKTLNTDLFLGKRIKDKINGDDLGLKGYELELTGGSDKAGFAMRYDLSGIGRKKILAIKGTGLSKSKKRGINIRKTVKGNTVNQDIIQINLKVTKEGAKKMEEIFVVETKAEEAKAVQ